MQFVVRFATEGSLIEMTHNNMVTATEKIICRDEFRGYKYSYHAGDVSFHREMGESSRQEKIRGDVVGFSVRSRSRLNKKMAMLKKHVIPLFVTLTYGKNFPLDTRVSKERLHKFFIYLRRRFPSMGAIWKLERQRRGADHFHILLWGVPFSLRDFIAELWYKFSGYQDELVLKFHKGELGNEHCVTEIRSWYGVMSYASKYLSKIDNNSSAPTGRIWGCVGDLPLSSIATFTMSMDEALEFRRGLCASRGYDFKRLGFWCNDFTAEWYLYLLDIIAPPEEPPPPDWFLELIEPEFYVPLEFR